MLDDAHFYFHKYILYTFIPYQIKIYILPTIVLYKYLQLLFTFLNI